MSNVWNKFWTDWGSPELKAAALFPPMMLARVWACLHIHARELVWSNQIMTNARTDRALVIAIKKAKLSRERMVIELKYFMLNSIQLPQ